VKGQLKDQGQGRKMPKW